MLNIKNTISVAALVCGLLIVFGTPKSASAQFLPPGSYQKTCDNINAGGYTLSAMCGRKSDTASKLGGGKKFPTNTELSDYFECDGSIWNDDGVLKCNRNTNSALMQKAKSALDAGYKNVVGVNGMTNDSYRIYLRLLFKDGMGQKFYEGNLGGMANLGLIPWFQTWLSKPENAGMKSGVIKRAFFEVYNYGPSPKDVAFYSNSLTGFQTIVLAEQKKMNDDQAIRRLMISEAYKYTMGRSPTKAEFDYWQPKQEYFMQIVEASRAYLYGGSVNGSKDLVETVKRAMNKNGNNPNPDIDQINKTITKYSSMNPKPVYTEMN